MSDTLQDIWKLMDEMRAHGVRPDLLSVLKTAKEQGITIDMDQAAFLSRTEGKTGIFVCPKFIPTFIASYLKESAPKAILDPWVGIGEMLTPLASVFEPTVAIGLCPDATSLEIVRLLHRDAPIDWRLGDPLLLLDDIGDRFDVVLGCPPLGWKPNSLTLTLDSGPVELRDSLDKLVMLKASMLLESSGVGFFVTSPNFIWRRGNRTVYSNLARFGLFVDAALALPSGTFSPATGIAGLLVVIRREKPVRLFVGELTSDPSSSDVLLKNLKSRKDGKVPQLGALVDSQSFRSFQTLVAEHEIEGLARALGLPPIPLSDIATEINLARPKQEQEFSDLPNAIYLPFIGRSPAVASLADLQIKPHNYAQIVLDPDRAIAAYVANSFNTSLGQKVRESLCIGTVIPKISKSQLLKASVYLPDLKTQTEAVRIHSIIADLSTQLETLQRQLWNQPRRAQEIERAIKSLNRDDDFETWMESLPFPLASILWAFHADANDEHKLSHLYNFFEALSQFIATVMLSAFAADESFYAQESADWIEKDPRYRDWFVASSFGGWNKLGERLAKKTRRLLSVKEKRERCLDLFGRPDTGFLEMLTSKKIFAILREVAEYRNLWKAHSGIVSRRESEDRLTLLKASLSQARQVMSDWYNTALLLSPESNEYTDGIFHYQVKALMGTRTTFKKVGVETLTPMDKHKLYLLHNNQLRPVELLPLFRLKESPRTQQNACYFYSRLVGEDVRWVSYHFEGEAELVCADNELRAALSLLRLDEEHIDEHRYWPHKR
jgi:hypothetical protein